MRLLASYRSARRCEDELLALVPEEYIGLAPTLARLAP